MSRGFSESSSTGHLSNNTSWKCPLNNSSATLHSFNRGDNNFLNHHPSAKFFSSSMAKRSRYVKKSALDKRYIIIKYLLLKSPAFIQGNFLVGNFVESGNLSRVDGCRSLIVWPMSGTLLWPARSKKWRLLSEARISLLSEATAEDRSEILAEDRSRQPSIW